MTITTAASSSISKLRHRKGFTLVEILIATVLSTMLLAACMSSAIFLMKSAYGSGNYADMNMQSRKTLDLFGRDVRQGLAVSSPTLTSFVISVPTGATTKQSIAYTFNNSTGILSRTSTTEKVQMLTNVTELKFKYFNVKNEESVLPLEIKYIQMEAKMVRKTLSTSNTDHLISARFTLRNCHIGS